MHEGLRRSASRFQVPVTPQALTVRYTGQLFMVTMFAVTIRTRQPVVPVAGHLGFVVQGLVVTRQTLGIVYRSNDFRIDPPHQPLEWRPRGVTRLAIVFDHPVCR
tara:strand:+ start:1416 stop:1730 length:315 start_codon:yes stop_codon:yes gene_type:complete